MPTYEITGPDGRTYEVTAPDGASQQEVLNYVQQNAATLQPEAEPQAPATPPMTVDMGGQSYQVPTRGDVAPQIKRQLGLTARAGIEGVAAIPSIVGDAANYAVNLPLRAINAAAGTDIPLLLTVSGEIRNVLSEMGLPEPESVTERLVNVVGSALSGMGGARAIQSGVSGIKNVEPVVRELGANPALQVAGAAGGAMSSEAAREAGITNPAALMAIGAVGSVLPGGGASIAQRAAGGAVQAAKPFTGGGREVIVGRTLNRLATDPEAATANAADARPLVPGSQPTLTQVSRDPGLIRAESALPDDTGVLAMRRSEQNQARMEELDRIARQPDTLDYATAKRDRAYDEIAAPAFRSATPVNIGNTWINNPILRTIQGIRETPAGARKTVQDAMDVAQDYITREGVDTSNVQNLYEIRKDLDLLRKGKLSGTGKSGVELSNLKVAKTQLDQVIGSIDDVIETGAPGYRDYMRLYAKRSVPLDQLKALQGLRERAVLSAPDPVTGQPILSQNKFTNLLRNNIAENRDYVGVGAGAANMRMTVPGTQEKVLARLSSQQVRTLDRIAADLDRSVAAQAGTMKTPGSDTFKNLSVASVIGRVLGDQSEELLTDSTTVKTLVRPLSFLYRVPDREIEMLLLDAWLDPQMASRFMKQATQYEVESIANELKRRASAQAAAQSVYGNEQPPAP